MNSWLKQIHVHCTPEYLMIILKEKNTDGINV